MVSPPPELMRQFPYTGFVGWCDHGEPDELPVGTFLMVHEIVTLPDHEIIMLANLISQGFCVMIGAKTQDLCESMKTQLMTRLAFAMIPVQGRA